MSALDAQSDTFDIITRGGICLDRQYQERRMYCGSRVFAQLTNSAGYHVGNRYLVSMRQARAVAGLDTSEFDNTIAQRAVQYPGHWGWLGRVMEVAGWRDSYLRERMVHLGWIVAGQCSYPRLSDGAAECLLDELSHSCMRASVMMVLLEDIVCSSHARRD